jgi:hypothetical protein
MSQLRHSCGSTNSCVCGCVYAGPVVVALYSWSTSLHTLVIAPVACWSQANIVSWLDLRVTQPICAVSNVCVWIHVFLHVYVLLHAGECHVVKATSVATVSQLPKLLAGLAATTVSRITFYGRRINHDASYRAQSLCWSALPAVVKLSSHIIPTWTPQYP